MRHSFLAFTLAAALTLGACTAVQPAATSAPAATETPAAEHGGHAGHDMHMSSDIPFEATFIDSMIEHHQGAVAMAQQVLEQSERPELRTLAEAIIAAQTTEIEQMQSWRAAWFPDLEPTQGMGMDMGDMDIAADDGKPFDQRFLEAMISHHEGAVAMAQMALDMSERAEIRTLAEAIIADQEAEIAQMRGWLGEWFGVTN